MKFKHDLRSLSWRLGGLGRMKQLWLFFAAAFALSGPCAQATKTKVATEVAQLHEEGTASIKERAASTLNSFFQSNHWVSAAVWLVCPSTWVICPHTTAAAAGLLQERVAAHTAAGDEPYRPFHSRFEQKSPDMKDWDFSRAENRHGYQRFLISNPHGPVVPNGRDANAQSTVVLVFSLTALATVIGALIIVDQLNIIGAADELNLVNYQRKMFTVVVFSALPWLLLGGWLLSIFVAFVGHPMRYDLKKSDIQCDAMVWYLVIAPILNVLYFTSHALWFSKLAFSVEKQAPMGRMFSLGNDMAVNLGGESKDGLSLVFDLASNAFLRHILFLLQVLSAIVGYTLTNITLGANSHYCQPEVYWAVTGLVVTGVVVVVATALAFVCSVLLRAFSISPWIQDFVESFWEGAISPPDEEKTREVEISGDAHPLAYVDWDDNLSEERDYHEDIMKDHAEYQAQTNEKAPERDRSMTTAADDDDDDPLVVWGDDESTPSEMVANSQASLPPAVDGGTSGHDGGTSGQGMSPRTYQQLFATQQRLGSGFVSGPILPPSGAVLPPSRSMFPTSGPMLPPSGAMLRSLPLGAPMLRSGGPMPAPGTFTRSLPLSGPAVPPGYLPGTASLPNSMAPPGTFQPNSFRQPPILSGSMVPSGYTGPPATGLPGSLPPGPSRSARRESDM